MYCDFYQMRERPFNVTADPKFLYLNARYREALASLHYGITQRKGFITLIGEAGTGKTTLLKKLLDDLDASTRTVFIFNTNVTFDEILEYIFTEFDLPIHNGKRLYMLQRLNTFLLDELGNGRNVALLIDEAQDLDYAALEDLRLLSNLETAKKKILQIALSGQPELGQKLGNPGLRQLRQRVAVNCRLLPLTREELGEYIQSRLSAAGCADPKLFSRDAEDRIFEISTGIPRLVNIVCDNALVIGYALGKKRIAADVVNEAAADLLSIEPREAPVETVETPVPVVPLPSPRSRSASSLGVIALVVVAILIGLLSVGRSLLLRESVPVQQESRYRAPLDVIRPGMQSEVPAPSAPEPVAPAVTWAAEDVRNADVVGVMRDAGLTTEVSVGEGHEVGQDGVAPQAVAANPPIADVLSADLPRGDVARIDAATEVGGGGRLRATAFGPGTALDPGGAVRAGGPQVRDEPVQVQMAAVPDPDPVGGVALQPVAGRAVTTGGASAKRRTAVVVTAPREDGAIRLALSRYQKVMVRPGDSVSQIAIRTYGQASYTILDLMKMANPVIRDIDVISIGQELRLPQLDEGLVLLKQANGDLALLLLSTPFRRQANDVRAALRRHGFDARAGRAEFGRGRTVWRVLIGGLASRADALRVGRQLRQLFRDDEHIAAMAH